MMQHGIQTDIVELDPMVYQYAKDYFGLLPDHTAHIMDAVKFVKDAAAVPEPEQWDYIIHDVFTGGAVPTVLFTTDMMQGMHKILKDDGVIAIVSILPRSLTLNSCNFHCCLTTIGELHACATSLPASLVLHDPLF